MAVCTPLVAVYEASCWPRLRIAVCPFQTTATVMSDEKIMGNMPARHSTHPCLSRIPLVSAAPPRSFLTPPLSVVPSSLFDQAFSRHTRAIFRLPWIKPAVPALSTAPLNPTCSLLVDSAPDQICTNTLSSLQHHCLIYRESVTCVVHALVYNRCSQTDGEKLLLWTGENDDVEHKKRHHAFCALAAIQLLLSRLFFQGVATSSPYSKA